MRDSDAAAELHVPRRGRQAGLAERPAVPRQGRAGDARRHVVPELPRRGATSWSPLYREYRERGFEDHRADVRAPRRVREGGARRARLSQDLGIEFPTLIAGLSETDEASKALPMLNGIYGYPTAILVDRSGRRAQHSHGVCRARRRDGIMMSTLKEFRDEVERLGVGPAG